jgi:hypothetical protein
MKGKILLILILLACVFLSMEVASAYYCFQEYANVSACGAPVGGTYSFENTWFVPSNIINANWEDFGFSIDNFSYVYENYTKPNGALSTSLWEVKSGMRFSNYSLPADCWGAYANQLTLGVLSNKNDSGAPGDTTHYWYAASCYNSTNWKNLSTYDGAGAANVSISYIYEEAMIWDIASIPVYPTFPFASNLSIVAAYTFDEPSFNATYGSRIIDVHKGKYNITNMGGIATWQGNTSAVMNNSLYFYTSSAHNATLPLAATNTTNIKGSNYSFSVWVKWDNNTGDSAGQRIWATDPTASTNDFQVSPSTKELSYTPSGSSPAVLNVTMPINIWTMLTFVCNNASTWDVYMNDTLVMHNTTKACEVSTLYPLRLASLRDSTPARVFGGNYDNLIIFNKSLNRTDIKDLYSHRGIWSNSTIYGLYEFSVDYDEEVYSTTTHSFYLNISYDYAYWNNTPTAYLEYNNTLRATVPFIGSNGYGYFKDTLEVPFVNAPKNVSFVWVITLANDTTSSTNDMGNYLNQTIYPIFIDNCTNYNKTIFNFTMLDEESLNKVNGTIQVDISLYNPQRTNLTASINMSMPYLTGSDSRICISDFNATYSLDYIIKHYINSTYFEKFRNIQNMTFTNSTPMQNVTLYNLLTEHGYPFEIAVYGNYLTPNGDNGLLVEVQKKYIPSADFKLVESAVTSARSSTYVHLTPNTQIYNFIVSYMGQPIATFNNYQVQCQNPSYSQCSISFNLGQATALAGNFKNYGNISSVYLMNTSSQVLYYTYTSTNGATHTILQTVVLNDAFGNQTICNITSTSTSATLTCAIPSGYGNQTILSSIYSDGVFVGSTIISTSPSRNLYGVDILMELFMFSTVVLLFIAHPIIIIFGAILGMLLSGVLIYITQGSLSSIIAAILYYVVGGGILIWQISKRL